MKPSYDYLERENTTLREEVAALMCSVDRLRAAATTMQAALTECAERLETYTIATMIDFPYSQEQYTTDMATVTRARAAAALLEGG